MMQIRAIVKYSNILLRPRAPGGALDCEGDMGRHYSTRDYFREMPNRMLARYFEAHGVLAELDFAAMKETRIDELFAAWLELPEGQRNEMDADFSEIHALSCEKGWCAIRDEAKWQFRQEPDAFTAFVERMGDLDGHFERAMVTDLDRRVRHWLALGTCSHQRSLHLVVQRQETYRHELWNM